MRALLNVIILFPIIAEAPLHTEVAMPALSPTMVMALFL